jgi:hypothetical protein
MTKPHFALLQLFLTFHVCRAIDDAVEYFDSVLDRSTYESWLEDRSLEYDKNLFLQTSAGDDGVAVFWKIHAEEEDVFATSTAASKRSFEEPWIQFAVVAPATGWVGFGISGAGGMLGSDIALFSAAKPDEIQDSYVVTDRFPQIDDCQSWELVNSVVDQEGGWIIVEMARPLDTKDPQDHKIINDAARYMAPTRLIAAWGDDSEPKYHGLNRAKMAVKLFGDETSEEDDAFHAKMVQKTDGYFDVVVSNYSIPSENVTHYGYTCVTYDELAAQGLVPEGKKLTMAGMNALVSPEMKQYLHHFILYAHNDPSSCNSTEGALIFGWAPGEKGFEFPENVGMSLFEDSDIASFTIETHYHNPLKTPGLIDDGSGIRLYFDYESREHEAGLLTLGDPLTRSEGTEIGSGLTEWSYFCDSTCSTISLKEQTITVISENLHMHASGTRMVNEVIRNDEVVHVGVAEVFEFEHQGGYVVQQEPFEIMPGDAFRTTCYYKDGTKFGMGSDDEMCIAFLLYYPVQKLEFGEYSFPWGCFYGVPLPVCSQVRTNSTLSGDEELGRYFGGTCTGAPLIGSDRPGDIGSGADIGSTSSAFRLFGTSFIVFAISVLTYWI